MDGLLQLDTDLFLYLNGLGTPAFDGFWMFITGKWNAIPMYAVLLFLLYKKLGIKNTIIAVVLVALMIVITDRVCSYFKFELLLRQRPCYELADQVRLVKDWCGSKGGYFSAHATNFMALAIFTGQILKKHLKYSAIVLFVWALMVGYSRIYIGVHYPGDVLTGFVFGATVGLLMYKLYEYISFKFAK
ncbi:MAG: phosphatase PAP2 family protein [Flavobacteriaceae bacterium]